MPGTATPSGPVVIGGLGGSGTRVIAEILLALGFYLGSDLNDASDNLWFTLLFKRPGWYLKARDDGERIATGLRILSRAMVGGGSPSPAEFAFVARAAIPMVFTGHNHRGSGRGRWPLRRALRILRAEPGIDPGSPGWGWKEPNAHVYLRHMIDYYDDFKYIHTVRHGLDMAFSANQQQLYNWGPEYGVEPPGSAHDVPAAALKYWVRANQRAVEVARTLGPERFLLVNFDEMCTSPEPVVHTIVSFMNVDPGGVDFDSLLRIPKAPRTIGRHREHDLNQFDPEDLDAVRALGFSFDAGPSSSA